jgi:hypothetical protein
MKGFGVFLAMAAQATADPLFLSLPEAQVTGKVVDETGNPMGNANLVVNFLIPKKLEWGTQDVLREGLTGSDGTFTASEQSGNAAILIATKAGYYKTTIGYYFFKEVVGGKWQPWNPTIEMVLKPIVKPIPMYAKRVETAIPAFNTPLPYDLSVGDWVAPRGKGKITDIIFTAKLDQRSDTDYNYSLTVSFPNKGDGIQVFEVPRHAGSEFKSPRHAPEEGYQPKWEQTRNRQPGKMEEGNYASDGNRNYFIRVRTVLDEKGKIKSANYGKIYGEFMDFSYYLNPTPNDRNMEFDPKRNLLMGLKSREEVNAP